MMIVTEEAIRPADIPAEARVGATSRFDRPLGEFTRATPPKEMLELLIADGRSLCEWVEDTSDVGRHPVGRVLSWPVDSTIFGDLVALGLWYELLGMVTLSLNQADHQVEKACAFESIALAWSPGKWSNGRGNRAAVAGDRRALEQRLEHFGRIVSRMVDQVSLDTESWTRREFFSWGCDLRDALRSQEAVWRSLLYESIALHYWCHGGWHYRATEWRVFDDVPTWARDSVSCACYRLATDKLPEMRERVVRTMHSQTIFGAHEIKVWVHWDPTDLGRDVYEFAFWLASFHRLDLSPAIYHSHSGGDLRKPWWWMGLRCFVEGWTDARRFAAGLGGMRAEPI